MGTSGLLKYFQQEGDKAKAAAQAIMTKSDEDSRELKPEEKAEIDAHLETFKMFQSKAAAEMTKIEIRDRLEAEAGIPSQPTAAPVVGALDMPNNIGDAFVQSGAWKSVQHAFKGGQLGNDWKSAAAEIPWSVLRGLKAAASPVLESNNTGLFGNGTTTAGILATLMGLETPGFVQIPPVIADLIPTIPVAVGNAVTYPVVAARTPVSYPGSEPVGEGALKPSALYSFTTATSVLRKFAAITKVSSEFLEDAPGLAAYINADLPLQLRLAEDAYLATVLNAAADTASVLGSGTKWDAILGAITEVRTNGFSPNGVVISPGNWAEVLTEVPSSGDGHYMSGSGPQADQTLRAWGVRVILSPAAADDLPLVGDFAAGAKLYRKGGLSVDSTNAAGSDDFEKNIITIRAEMREVLGITYPEAFRQADIS